MFSHKSLRTQKYSVQCVSFGTSSHGGLLGFVFPVNDFWMFQNVHSKCWITVSSISLGDAASGTEAYNMSPFKLMD